jgi:hypothetical protein
MAGNPDTRVRKRQILTKKLERLWGDYDAAITQSTNSLSAVDGNKLDRAAEEIYEKIEKVDAEIQALDLAPAQPEIALVPSETGRRNDLIRDKLPEIDFKALEQALRTIIDDHSQQGCAALLLLRHSRLMAGEWGAKRVRRILRDATGVGLFRHLELEFGAWQTVDAMALLAGLAHHLNVATAPDFPTLSRLVADTLCGSLTSGSVVLIECRRCDDLLIQMDTLRELVQKFWAELVRSLTSRAAEHAEIKIVLLLLAEEELAECCVAADCCCSLDDYRRERLMEVRLEAWTPADIVRWIGRYSGSSLGKRDIDRWAERLHRANNGIPLMIADALLNQCCSS